MQNAKFITVYSTNNHAELALIKSLLNTASINYFITNENFNSLYGVADGLTLMDIKVMDDKVEEAKELLKDFINPVEDKF